MCASNRVLLASKKLFSKMQGKSCNFHFDTSICKKSDVPKEYDQYDLFKELQVNKFRCIYISLELKSTHVKPCSS